jgi:anti-sigma factor RsiW
MSCSDPPPLDDETIDAALDGDMPLAVAAHLQDCAYCASRLEEARQFETALRGHLARWDCPSPEELGDYHLGLVPPAQQRAVAAHLEMCPRCSAEIEDLRVFLMESVPVQSRSEQQVPSVRPEPIRRLRALAAQLLPRAPGFQLAGVRGGGDGPLIAQSSAATIILEPQKIDPRTVRITGQIADEAGDQERWDGALVEVRQADTVVAVAFVDEVGGFTCAPIQRSTTDLRITGVDGTWIVVDDIEL